MQSYIVIFEDPGIKGQMRFLCKADNADHAREQAVNAYPTARIISVSLSPVYRTIWSKR